MGEKGVIVSMPELDLVELHFSIIDTVGGSEIPRPTTGWMYPKPGVNNGDKLPFPQLVSLPDF